MEILGIGILLIIILFLNEVIDDLQYYVSFRYIT